MTFITDSFECLNRKPLLSENELKIIAPLVKEGQTPLWTFWDEFTNKYLRSGKSEVTVKNVRDAFRFIIRRLDILTIDECNNARLLEDKLHEYKSAKGISNTTFNSYLKDLNTYFRWLKKQGHIKENNISNVERCKQEINEQYTLSQRQVDLVYSQIRTRRQTRLLRKRNSFFIDLLRFTGARPCELLNIQMKDISQHKNTYKIVIKGRKQKGRARYYPFPSWIRDSYEDYKDIRYKLRPHETYLFISSSKNSKWTEKGMRNLFRRLSSELGFRVIAYGFRRYVATTLHTKGTPMKDIQNYLGHTRITTTQGYIERSCCLTETAAEVMAESNFIPKNT